MKVLAGKIYKWEIKIGIICRMEDRNLYLNTIRVNKVSKALKVKTSSFLMWW